MYNGGDQPTPVKREKGEINETKAIIMFEKRRLKRQRISEKCVWNYFDKAAQAAAVAEHENQERKALQRTLSERRHEVEAMAA